MARGEVWAIPKQTKGSGSHRNTRDEGAEGRFHSSLKTKGRCRGARAIEAAHRGRLHGKDDAGGAIEVPGSNDASPKDNPRETQIHAEFAQHRRIAPETWIPPAAVHAAFVVDAHQTTAAGAEDRSRLLRLKHDRHHYVLSRTQLRSDLPSLSRTQCAFADLRLSARPGQASRRP